MPRTVAQKPAYKVLVLYSTNVKPDHLHSANDALALFRAMEEKIILPSMPQPIGAKLDRSHAVTKQLPAPFAAPANEWYLWKPGPRLNKNVHVLVTLDPSNYPIGVKDIITGGDLPVVWIHTKYRMISMNMGHGDKICSDATQNLLIAQAFL